MTLFQSILLGLIQGLTEFLPISSSAHLVITPYLLGWRIPAQNQFIFAVLVQLGTLVSVIVYFWQDLAGILKAFLAGILHRKPFTEPKALLGWYLILATIPAVVFGLLIKDLVEQAFTSPIATALFLLVTAAMMIIAERMGRKTRTLEQLSWLDALVIGIFQVISLFPGVSRSGATITGGMLRHLTRSTAARFSFLMSVPVMIGAGIIALLDLFRIPNFLIQLPTVFAGFLSAAIVGYLSIRWLLAYLSRRSLYVFAGYCILLSFIILIVVMVRRGG
jgi:undecaprenyl-diphosphatase